MNITDSKLSTELQELYLENKETLSDIVFMEDETRFFQKLVEKVLLSPAKEDKFQEIEIINTRMADLLDRREKLKNILTAQQQSIEAMLKDNSIKIELSLIAENTSIAKEIKSLLSTDKFVKKELYTLVEQVLLEEKAGHLLNA